MSGLRDPARAASGLAMAALGLEALSVLLAIAPMNMLLDDPGSVIVALLILHVAFLVLLAQVRKPRVWKIGMALQIVFIFYGFFHIALGVAGVVFALTWAYCWKIANDLSRPPKRDASNPNFSPEPQRPH